MRRLTPILLIAIFTLLLTGCNPNAMLNYKLDNRLPKLNSVKVIASNTAIGLSGNLYLNKV